MTREELKELIDAHQAELYRYLKYLGADHSVAEDLLQEAYLRAYRAKTSPDIRDIQARKSWMRRITQNLFLDHCRRSQRSPVAFNSETLEEAQSFWETEFIASNDGFDRIEALRECLATLPDKQRKMIHNFYAERQSRVALAEIFGVSPNGIKMALRRIRLALGTCIEQRVAE